MSDIKKLAEQIHPQTIEERIHTWEQMAKKHSEHHSLKQAVIIIRHFETTIESQKEEIEKLRELLKGQLHFVQSLHQLTNDPITKEQCRLSIISLQEGDK